MNRCATVPSVKLGLGGGWGISTASCSHFTHGKEHCYLLYRMMDGFQGRCGQVCTGENWFVVFKGTKNFSIVLERSWNLSSSALQGLTEKFKASVWRRICYLASDELVVTWTFWGKIWRDRRKTRRTLVMTTTQDLVSNLVQAESKAIFDEDK